MTETRDNRRVVRFTTDARAASPPKGKITLMRLT